MRIGDRWVTDKQEYLASIDPRDPAARVELHRGLMKSRAGEDASYPANPFRGFEEVGNH